MSSKASEVRVGMVPMGSMEVYPDAQRERKQARVDHLLNGFDETLVGQLEVCHRNGRYYILDGQHRFEAYKLFLGEGWERKHTQCRIRDNLTDKEMAELFLRLNDTLSVTAFDKFEKSVIAKRPDEFAVNKIVTDADMVVKLNSNDERAIACVGTIMRVYRKLGGVYLARALKVADESFGSKGLTALAIEGLALVCHRYDKQISDSRLIDKLSHLKGGAGLVESRAAVLQQKFKKTRSHCYAAAVIDILNTGLGTGSRKLPNWWQTE